MFNTDSFGAAGKRLNAEYLKGLPQMAVKAVIVGGGVKAFEDREKGGTQQVPFLTLSSSAWEGEKELSLNATNRNYLGAALGKQANAWVGQEIGIYFDPTVTYAGKAVGGVKVKVLRPDPFSTPAPVAAAAPVAEEVPF